MSSQSTRLIASSDKYWLQQIANNTAITGNSDIQKLAPTSKQDTLQSVGIYGNDDTGKWQSLKVSADGTLAVDLSIDESTLATEAKQDTMISRLQAIEDETQANGISLSSIETDTEIIKNTQATLLSTNQQILVDTTTIVATQDDILNELVGIGESTGNITKGVDATLTEAQQVLTYGLNTNSNNCKALEIDNAGNLKTTLQSVNGQVVMKTNDATLNAKVSKGEDTTIPSGSGGLQQILCYGQDNQGDLEPFNIDNSGHLKITINDVDETNTGLKIAGETQLGTQVSLRVGNNGNLRTHETLERINTTETITIADGSSGSGTTIDMSDYQYLAIFGTTNNTFNKNIFLEYSADNTNFYKGSGDNSKIIIVGATGDFYDQERIITKYVRIARTNASGASESLTVNYTRA